MIEQMTLHAGQQRRRIHKGQNFGLSGGRRGWDNLRDSIQTYTFSRSVLSDSLRPHDSQHARPPCASQTPGVYSDSCPSSR